MNSQPTPSGPDRIRDLLRKIQALADDPAAAVGERDAALAKLRCLLKRHGLTEADLLSETLQTVRLNYDHKDDFPILCNIVLETLNVSNLEADFHCKSILQLGLMVTPADAVDLKEAWLHYRPIIAAARKQAAAEQQELRKRARAIGTGFASAFVDRFSIYPPKDPTPRKRLTTAQICRIIVAQRAAAGVMRDVEGDKWTRKAGYVAAGTHQLAAG
jgi:hypothetical protein